MTQQQKERLAQLEAQLGPELEQISHYIFTHAELGLQEYQSAAFLERYMEQQGFSVEKGVWPCLRPQLDRGHHGRRGGNAGPLLRSGGAGGPDPAGGLSCGGDLQLQGPAGQCRCF